VVDANGQPLADAQIGIATVPPELVRDMLPAGLLQHTFDLTIQAPGAAAFTTPLQLTLPNVFNAAPGTKLNLLSFDHTTGRLVIDGTGTVSEDGLYVVTDPDTGVTKPGWHGMTPPGNCAGDGGAPPPPPEPTPKDTESTLAPEVLKLVTDEDGRGFFGWLFGSDFYKKEWKAPDKLPDTPPDDGGQWAVPNAPKDPAGKKQPYLKVEVKVDGPLADFMKSTGNVDLNGASFTLVAGSGETKTLGFVTRAFNDLIPGGLKNLEKDILYGSKITIKEITGKADGSTDTKTQDIYVTRFVDAADDDHDDGVVTFSDAALAGVSRDVPVEVKAGGTGLAMAVSAPSDFRATSSGIDFDPSAEGDRSARLGFSYGSVQVAEKLDLAGKGAPKQRLAVDVQSLVATLADIASGSDRDTSYPEVSPSEIQFFDNLEADGRTAKPTERLDLANQIANAIYGNFSPYGDGLTTGAGAGDTIRINFGTDGNGFIFVTKRTGLYGTSSPAGGVDNASAIKSLLEERAKYSNAELAFRLDELVNPSLSGRVDVFPDTHLEEWGITNIADFVRIVSETATHEYGHTLSLVHTYKVLQAGTQEVVVNGVLGQTDMMMGHAGDLNPQVLHFTSITDAALRIATNLNYTIQQATDAVSYFVQNIINAGFYSTLPGVDEPEDLDFLFQGPRLGVSLAETGGLMTGGLDFGAVIADGPSGASSIRHLNLFNYGTEALVLHGVTTTGGAFAVSAPVAGTMIAPGASLVVDVTFDPSVVGAASTNLRISTNDASARIEYALNGSGQAATPYISVDAFDNNLGGVEQGDTVLNPATYTLSNQGAAPLVISAIAFAPGSTGFSLFGVPNDLAAHPITLGYGESWSFGASLAGGELGLLNGQILVTSNAANTPTLSLSTVATGYDEVYDFDWGEDYIAVDVNGSTLRAKSDAQGHFSLFLPAESDYWITAFDPESGLVAHNQGHTPQSGIGVNLSSGLVFEPGILVDSDFDGLADDIEHAIGTSQTNRDSNGDGISDFQSLRLGIDPLAGVSLPTGVIASLALDGTAHDVVMAAGLTGAASRTAIVGTGTAGIALVNVDVATKPTIIATLDLPGDARALAFDPITKVLAVATTTTLELVSLANAAAPKVLASIAAGAQAVQVLDGIAYATVGSSLQAFDLQTGAALGSLALGGTLTGLAREETHLYTLDSSGTVRAVRLVGDGSMVAEGTLSLPGNGQSWAASGTQRDLTVAEGVLYIPADNGFQAGYATVRVSNPLSPALLSGPDATNIAGGSIALNGAGGGVIVGHPGGVFGTNALDVIGTTDPANTGAFVTRIGLPAAPEGVALGNGFAFVADGTSGLQVVNYLARDVGGVAPTVTLDTTGLDSNPGRAGIQVLEGSIISLHATVRDDVQVSEVQVLRDGVALPADPSYPWDLRVALPTLDAGATQVTLQVRATDTGGNVGLSAPLVIDLVRDEIAPTLVSQNVAAGATVGVNLRTFRFTFSEALNPETVSSDSFHLIGQGGAEVTATSVALVDGGRGVNITFAPLALGPYLFRIDANEVTDRAGNALGAGVLNTPFTVDESRIHVEKVGYYEMSSGGYAASYLVAPITGAGLQAVAINSMSQAELDSVDALFVTNQSNGDYGSEYMAARARIAAFVEAGGVLVIHDRYVDPAETMLPNLGAIDIRRDFAGGAQINFVNDTGEVARGPGGNLTDASLDNGNWSNHGFTIGGSLPADAVDILTTNDAGRIVTFAAHYGDGVVVYSSIPLDYYLGGGGGLNANMRAYATNLLGWIKDGADFILA